MFEPDHPHHEGYDDTDARLEPIIEGIGEPAWVAFAPNHIKVYLPASLAIMTPVRMPA